MSLSTVTASLGPVSKVLEADLRDWVAKHSLVIWLDADELYGSFVETLIELRHAEQLKYDVFAFRGSHLELMLALENVTAGFDTTRAVIHLPGFNEESVKATPLFELYRAGKRYRKGLDTLVRDAAGGHVRPDQIDDFLRRSSCSLSDADVWLNDLMTTGTEGLASQLRKASLIELVDDLLANQTLARKISAIDFQSAALSGDQIAVRDRIVSLTGMPATWFDESLQNSYSSGQDPTSVEAVAFAICSWSACVSFVHDLLVPPKSNLLEPVPRLPAQVREACHQLIVHLQTGNERQSKFYRQTALETESRLTDDVGRVRAEDLGHFDTFFFEEETILTATLQAILERRWAPALDWATRRQAPNAFWLKDDILRRNVWQLLGDAARLGCAIEAAGNELHDKQSIQSAVDEYVRIGAAVDQAHRHLEQNRQKLWGSQMPKFEQVRTALDGMQRAWRNWADRWAIQFNAVCRTHGFLPESSLQQRNVFDQEVKPLVSPEGTTAFFVVDALRYEMGLELLEAIGELTKTDVSLSWRLAELPTVTEVGMNVLAPVAKSGRLQPELAAGKLLGFSTGEFRVNDPDSRRRAMHDRVGGRTCPRIELEEVLKLEVANLRRKIAGARLVMIHSREIDGAGEAGFGPTVFETVLKDLRSAWHLLREAGVRNFVFTGDHGFLLIDEQSALPSHDRAIGGKRRHVVSDRAADHSGEVRVSMRQLGYDCEDLHLMFPESVAVYDNVRDLKGFAHGGNSLQERVIPVLKICHRLMTGGSTTSYELKAKKKDAVAGMQCITCKVTSAQKSLDFGSSFEVDLAIRVVDDPGVRVEHCETRGGARLMSGTVWAMIGEEFEVFFRLTGTTTARVQVELYHPSKEAMLEPCPLKERFEVSRLPDSITEPTKAKEVPQANNWIDNLPEGGVRRVFQHLAQHGNVTEAEISDMLGGARELRKFSRSFEAFAACAPFEIRIDVVAGIKRYVREGASQ